MTTPNVGEDIEQLEFSYIVGGTVKWHNTRLIYSPVLVLILVQEKCNKKMIKMCTTVLTAALFIIAQLKITQISVNRKTGKQIVEYSHNGLLLSHVTNGRISETLSWAKEARRKRAYSVGVIPFICSSEERSQETNSLN